MKIKIKHHELLSTSDIVDNCENMMSYEAMRETLVKLIKKARGATRIHLEQTLDVLDLTCQIQVEGGNSDMESEIYSILS